jgi:hypothetical protein
LGILELGNGYNTPRFSSSESSSVTSDGKSTRPVKALDSSSKTSWWSNPTIMVPAAIGVLGLLVTLYLGLSPRSAPTKDPLAECQRHNPQALDTALSTEAMTPAGTGETSRFEGCVWPPRTGTDKTGHWVIQVSDYTIPGSYAAQQFTDVQIFDTSCVALTLDYQFSSQQTTAHSRFTVETTQTVSGYTGQPVNLGITEQPPPRPVVEAQGSHLLVLINSRYELKRVKCVDLPNPPPA